MIRSFVAVAKIVDPSAVRARLSGQQYDNGAIFVECPEMGMQGSNLIYCRYGLSLPYVKVRAGQKVWIEPTIHDNERWKYTGFVDCGGFSPADADEVFFGSESSNRYMKITSTEMKFRHATPKFYNGLKVINPVMHTHTSGAVGAQTADPTDGT